jgi:hypothetical protein
VVRHPEIDIRRFWTMNGNKMDRAGLEQALAEISAQGIGVDRKKLIKDMCAQFPDYRLWIREYVVNAFDAGARHCYISGIERDGNFTITIGDDGWGMDRNGVLNFSTVFRSVKQGNPDANGFLGVGKLSVAAIPGQNGYKLLTSTGIEAWRMEAGCLLDNAPIRLERVEPVPERGTCFEITFKQTCSLTEELKLLARVLERYVRYLPIGIVFYQLREGAGGTPEEAQWLGGSVGSWSDVTERFAKAYQFTSTGERFDLVIGLDKGTHEIYQGKVFVSDRYNLISYGLAQEFKIPHLKIRVDSRAFELPFGRHRLLNEDLLRPLARHVREHILPLYTAELFRGYEDSDLAPFEVHSMEVENIACALMALDKSPTSPWCRVAVFKMVDRPRMSLKELHKAIKRHGVLYLAAVENEDQDASAFNAPVISRRQPEGGLDLIKSIFGELLVDLKAKDVVMEATAENAPSLGEKEVHFQRFLGFHPASHIMDLLAEYQKPKPAELSSGLLLVSDLIEGGQGAKDAIGHYRDLAVFKWRLSYLVERDGKMPCKTRRFMVRGQEVILNLYHEEVGLLLRLSEEAPALAAHWAVGMCLTDGGGFMTHLSAETREELILLDAMARCSGQAPESPALARAPVLGYGRAFREFRRNIEHFDPQS